MKLGVVVTIVDGGEALSECLSALAASSSVHQVYVPWDSTLPAASIADLAAKFPAVKFSDLGLLPLQGSPGSVAGRHELFDRRRAAGLAEALADGAELVGLVEDRAPPLPGWGEQAVRLHASLPHAAIGGTVELASGAPALAGAVYLCDYGRYQPPQAAGRRCWLTDINVTYKRRALEVTRKLWAQRYNEATVHWALQQAGETLWLDPALCVAARRRGLTVMPVLRERFGWAQVFAQARARELGPARRLALAALTPVLPAVLLLRQARAQIAGRRFLRWLGLSPLIALLLVAWSAGEAAGTISRRDSLRRAGAA